MHAVYFYFLKLRERVSTIYVKEYCKIYTTLLHMQLFNVYRQPSRQIFTIKSQFCQYCQRHQLVCCMEGETWVVGVDVDREKRCRKTSSEKSGKQQLAVGSYTSHHHHYNSRELYFSFLCVRKYIDFQVKLNFLCIREQIQNYTFQHIYFLVPFQSKLFYLLEFSIFLKYFDILDVIIIEVDEKCMYNFPKCNTDMILLRFSKEGKGTEGCRELQ